MPGLVPGINVLEPTLRKRRDGRKKRSADLRERIGRNHQESGASPDAHAGVGRRAHSRTLRRTGVKSVHDIGDDDEWDDDFEDDEDGPEIIYVRD